MNCDQVFEVLTRGPFPTGDPSDAHVEVHLGQCPDCAELAEALRPALELFEEAVPAAEGRDLPGYFGTREAVPSLAAEVAKAALLQTSASAVPSAPPPRRAPLRTMIARHVRKPTARLAGALLLGAVLGALLVGFVGPSMQLLGDTSFRTTGPAPEAFSPLAAYQQLAHLEVPPSCRAIALGGDFSDETQSPQLPLSDPILLVCCTECHHADKATKTPTHAKRAMGLSCSLCHIN